MESFYAWLDVTESKLKTARSICCGTIAVSKEASLCLSQCRTGVTRAPSPLHGRVAFSWDLVTEGKRWRRGSVGDWARVRSGEILCGRTGGESRGRDRGVRSEGFCGRNRSGLWWLCLLGRLRGEDGRTVWLGGDGECIWSDARGTSVSSTWVYS